MEKLKLKHCSTCQTDFYVGEGISKKFCPGCRQGGIPLDRGKEEEEVGQIVIQQQEHYGEVVWTNLMMDRYRKKQCLCLNCGKMSNCSLAKHLLEFCKEHKMAMAITRCKVWTS